MYFKRGLFSKRKKFRSFWFFEFFRIFVYFFVTPVRQATAAKALLKWLFFNFLNIFCKEDFGIFEETLISTRDGRLYNNEKAKKK